MHASTLLGAALALCGTAVAAPPRETEPPVLRPRDYDNDDNIAAGPWVTVDDEGQPSTTYTPSFTSVGNTVSAIDGAPHDLTASVYTFTEHGRYSTSTGSPPNPTLASSNSKVGVFSRCYNKQGPYAPFCRPSYNSTVYTDWTYFVTWDPDYYNKTHANVNSTYMISLRVDGFHSANNSYGLLALYDQQDSPAWWGYSPLRIDPKWKDLNVTITLMGHYQGSHELNNSVALPVMVKASPLPPSGPTPAPKGQTLVIALPVVFGTIALLLIGGCIWNRKTRHINLGNVMSRSRHGYTGRRHRNLFSRKNKDQGIQLHESPLSPPPADYRDVPERARRDSDALGSLTGSPVRGTFEEPAPGARNAFRDEMDRQDRQRRGNAL